MARIADTFEIPDYEEPLVYNLMSKEQFNAEIEKGIYSVCIQRSNTLKNSYILSKCIIIP